jgi:hypothetical protein
MKNEVRRIMRRINPAGERVEIAGEIAEASLAAVVVPEDEPAAGHHRRHLAGVVLDVWERMRSVDEPEIDRSGVRSRIEGHRVAEDLRVPAVEADLAQERSDPPLLHEDAIGVDVVPRRLAVGRQIERDDLRAGCVQHEHARRAPHERADLEHLARLQHAGDGGEDEQLVEPRAAVGVNRDRQLDAIVGGRRRPALVVDEVDRVAADEAVAHQLVVALNGLRPVFARALAIFHGETHAVEARAFHCIDQHGKAHSQSPRRDEGEQRVCRTDEPQARRVAPHLLSSPARCNFSG